jgi:1-acyl-sn-glycerol-3-phosphate acyltransferase
MHALDLLRHRRYWPLFWTQFLGAFNDNLFKNALVILVTFRAMRMAGLTADQLVALAGLMIVLPFVLLSAHAGQLSDKLPKASLMRAVKVAEIGIMGVGAIGLWLGSLPLLFTVVLLMGVHSTVFGPSKYSILPQLLPEHELLAGNALVEMGTNLAILAGTVLGGVLISLPHGEAYVAVASLVAAGAGLATSRWIPDVPAQNPTLAIAVDPVTPTLQILGLTVKVRSVWLSILGISWFWAFGAAFLSLFPGWTKDVVHGDEHVATLFLTMFSVGIAIGSVLCERMSRRGLELGLVPIGSFGMSLFTFDLFLVGEPWHADPTGPIGLVSFLGRPMAWRILGDLAGVAVFGGFFIVPLYTLMQLRTDPGERSRVVAGNNIINSIFMVIAALAQTWAITRVSTWQFFGILAVVNAIVAAYIYTVLPEFFWRLTVFVLSNVIYRLDVAGLEKLPKEGAFVGVANHVTFIDWMIVAGAMPRPARFVMADEYYRMPLVNLLFRQVNVIPIASRKQAPELVEQAFDQIAAALEAGEPVFVFPEGQLTANGEIGRFRPGIEQILARNPVPVVPMVLNGLWGSYFSRRDGQALQRPFRRVWSRIRLTILDPVPPTDATAASLEATVRAAWEKGAP